MILSADQWTNQRQNLEALFFESFGKQLSENYLDWRYCHENCSPLLFSVELDHDTPLASYSLCPIELQFNSSMLNTALSMTTMTHPKLRGKGLFPKLASELYEKAAHVGVRAVWGFPNANSHMTFITKLGWEDIYEIPTLRLELRKEQIAKYIDVDSPTEDSLFEMDYPEMPKDGLWRIKRSKDYLRWRYVQNPDNSYYNFVHSSQGIVTSYLVFKFFENQIDLVDVQVANEAEAALLVSQVIRKGLLGGVDCLNCWAPTHHFLHSVLERRGFKNDAPVTYFGVRSLVHDDMTVKLLSYKNWYIQMGDSDVY